MNNTFRKIFNCCWRESPFSLQFHTGCLSMHLITDQQMVLFYKRVLNSSNVVLQKHFLEKFSFLSAKNWKSVTNYKRYNETSSGPNNCFGQIINIFNYLSLWNKRRTLVTVTATIAYRVFGHVYNQVHEQPVRKYAYYCQQLMLKNAFPVDALPQTDAADVVLPNTLEHAVVY